MEEKILVQFQSEGYVINPNHPELSKSICYGGIVVEILNKYYGNTVKSDNMGIAKIQELQNMLSRSTINFTSLVDPWLGNLPLIASDRARFVKQISDKRKQIIISPRTVEIEYYWDKDRQAIGQQAYVEKIDDLLAYDICKVLESNMVIKQCYCERYFIAGRKSMKYCQEHRAEGQRITRQENLKNDRCRKKHKQIKDRLYQPDSRRKTDIGVRNQYLKEYDLALEQYESGGMTEPDFYEFLCEMDRKYRRRTKK